MAYMDTEIRDDGSLYCDIDLVEKLGFPLFTMINGFPIHYDESKFKDIGKTFLKVAQSTCPVDTGFLRDHHGANADSGGVELWSDATYSAYQEYGTSRCKPQPWFESAIMTAVAQSDIYNNFAIRQSQYDYVDDEYTAILMAVPTSIPECEYWISRCDMLIDYITFHNIDIPGIVGLIQEQTWRFIEIEDMLMEAEEEQQAMMGEIGFDPLGIVMMLVMAFVVAIMQTVIQEITSGMTGDAYGGGVGSYDSPHEHNPTH